MLRVSRLSHGPALPAALFVLLTSSACVMGGRMSSSTSPFDVITEEEIRKSSATNAYDLVAQVRPNWLRGRGPSDFRGNVDLPVVYVAGMRQGSVAVLRSILTEAIVRLRFIDATTATTRYGDGHSGGVIEVVLRPRGVTAPQR